MGILSTPHERIKLIKEKGIILFPGLTKEEKKKILYIPSENKKNYDK